MADYDEDAENTDDSEDSTEIDTTNGAQIQKSSDIETDDDSAEESEEEIERDEEQDAKDLARLQQQIKSNPYDYDAYVQLIQLARICGELVILQTTREKMSELFPLTEELWKGWLEDETKPEMLDKTDAVAVTKIDALYERAVKDYLSVDLWLDYAMFKLSDFSEESLQPVRTVFERALTAVGLHVPKGIIVWTSYLEIEQAYLATLVPALGEIQTPDNQARYEKQVQRVKDLFKRQLKVPLIGMDDALTEYTSFTGQEIEPNIQKSFDKAKAKLNAILQFEQELEAATDSERYGIFMAYIEKEKEPVRIAMLYERALVPYCLSPDLWMKYLDFLDRQLKNPEVSRSAHERSLRNLPWTLDLRLSYLRAAELFGENEAVVKGIFDEAYIKTCSLPSHFVQLWLAYLSYLRRRISAVEGTGSQSETNGNGNSAQITALKETFATAITDLETKGADSDNKIERFFATVQASLFHDVEAGRLTWGKIMKSHQWESEFWLAYYRFERVYGDLSHARKVMKTAILRNLDHIDAVAVEWMQFEAELGSLTDWFQANDFCRDSIKRVADRQAKLDRAAQLEAEKLAAPKKNFRLRDTYEDNRDDSQERPRRNRERPTGTPDGTPEKRQDKKQPNSDSRKRPHEEAPPTDQDGFKVPGLPAPPIGNKKQKVVDAPTGLVDPSNAIAFSKKTPEGNKEERTVFLSNLGYNTTERGIFDLFHTAGGIVAIRFGKDLRGKSRGFCYVEFDHVDGVQEALKLDRHDLDGRPVFVAKDSKDQRESHYKGTGGEEKNKLFIRGLQTAGRTGSGGGVTKEDLVKIFQEYGELKDVRIVTHKNGMSKGIAYVEYADAVTATKAMEATNGKEVQGRPMIVAISNPPAITPKPRSEMFNFDPSKQFRPVVVPPPDGQRKSRSHVNLLPRALLKQQTDAQFLTPAVPAAKPASSVDPAAAASVKKSNDEFRALFKKK